MNYNFDEIINRNGTDSVKWDAVERRWGRNDLIPMWVADMDFRTAPFVIDALKKRLEHEVLGYTFACKEWAESIINWLKERHGWEIREEMLTFTPGIVRGLAFAIHCFTEKGDKVSNLSAPLPVMAGEDMPAGPAAFEQLFPATQMSRANIGKLIGLSRETLWVTTKLRDSEQGYDSALKAFDNSLKLLQLDYVETVKKDRKSVV